MNMDERDCITEGVENGIQWKVLLSPLGFCAIGYARLPDGHPWLGKDYDDVPADVHGGLTYSDSHWIGFDTAHAGDVWLADEVDRIGGTDKYSMGASHGYEWEREWSLEMVVAECQSLCLQIAAVQS